jgi:hypothetical protein
VIARPNGAENRASCHRSRLIRPTTSRV